jgi:hypothetical protein
VSCCSSWEEEAAASANDLQITETDEVVITHHTTADRNLNILMFLNVIALWPYLPVSWLIHSTQSDYI